MPLRRSLLAGLLIGLVSSAPASSAAGPETEFAFFHENVLGTSLELRVNAQSREAAQAAEERVLGEIDRLAAIFNGYDPASELSRWQDRYARPRRASRRSYSTFSSTRIYGSGKQPAHSTRAPRP